MSIFAILGESSIPVKPWRWFFHQKECDSQFLSWNFSPYFSFNFLVMKLCGVNFRISRISRLALVYLHISRCLCRIRGKGWRESGHSLLLVHSWADVCQPPRTGPWGSSWKGQVGKQRVHHGCRETGHGAGLASGDWGERTWGVCTPWPWGMRGAVPGQWIRASCEQYNGFSQSALPLALLWFHWIHRGICSRRRTPFPTQSYKFICIIF